MSESDGQKSVPPQSSDSVAAPVTNTYVDNSAATLNLASEMTTAAGETIACGMDSSCSSQTTEQTSAATTATTKKDEMRRRNIKTGKRQSCATIKPDSVPVPQKKSGTSTEAPETCITAKASAMSTTVTRSSSRDTTMTTSTVKTRTSAAAAAAAAAATAMATQNTSANLSSASTLTMMTRQSSSKAVTSKTPGNTTSLTVGGRSMSGGALTPAGHQESLVKRRSSSRSIKRRKFDDELVESSLVKSTRGKLPPTSAPSTTTTATHHSPPPPALPPPPPLPQVAEKVIELPEKVPEPPSIILPAPPVKKPEVPKKPKEEPAPVAEPPAPKQPKLDVPRSAPEKKKGKSLPSKSNSSKSSRSKKSKSIIPLARETSRWKPEDDLALITAVHQTNDLEQVYQGVKFSHRFSMKEIEERWYALLYDPIASKASQTAMRLLHPDIKISIMAQALYSEDEEKILGTVASTSQPTVDTFQELINKNSSTFHPMRTAKGLHTHWLLVKQYHLLPDQSVQPMPRGDHVLNFSDAEDMLDDGHLHRDPRDEILEHELAAFDRRQKRQIRHLENEIPKWQVLVENVTGMTSQEFDNQTLAVLRGRLVRYLMRSKEITIGRSSKDNAIDVDLSLEGPAWKVSRKQGVIKLRNNGEFYLANEGKRAVHIDGKPVLRGQKWKLTNNSVVEIAGLRFIFLVNQDLINVIRTETSKVNI